MDDDTEQAAWAQLENEERHRREDEGLERHRVLLEEFRRTNAEYIEWERNWHFRMQQLKRENHEHF